MGYIKQSSVSPSHTKQTAASPSHTNQTAADPTETSAVPATGTVKELGETKWSAWLPDSEENICEMDVLEEGQLLGSQDFVWELGMNTLVLDPESSVAPMYTKESSVAP